MGLVVVIRIEGLVVLALVGFELILSLLLLYIFLLNGRICVCVSSVAMCVWICPSLRMNEVRLSLFYFSFASGCVCTYVEAHHVFTI